MRVISKCHLFNRFIYISFFLHNFLLFLFIFYIILHFYIIAIIAFLYYCYLSVLLFVNLLCCFCFCSVCLDNWVKRCIMLSLFVSSFCKSMLVQLTITRSVCWSFSYERFFKKIFKWTNFIKNKIFNFCNIWNGVSEVL